MLRKHINSIPKENSKTGHVPFYSWQCVTIEMEHKEMDLIIKDEFEMDVLLGVITYHMNTCNNERNSAIAFVKKADYCERIGLVREVKKKYFIMRIRAKIACIASENLMTVKELLMRQILKTYYVFLNNGLIPISLLDMYK
jgi:hypothetical protein